ncbi:TIGR04283 family arsenosugar biosynthesis glycosyltransferase [Flavobacteriaceae bacterium KMM 6898]|nr:TIGR04283 family arsenosugar biosynthesis glycosyltransferase [Flavobacteriaceae bacterium KMM 6898]
MLSIVIPAHNEKANIESLFKILSKQLKQHPSLQVEVLVILSGGNTDGAEQLKHTGPFHIIQCQDKGRAVQMNLGAKMAKGSILAFLHADSIPPKGFLNNIYETISDGYGAGLFSYKFDKSGLLLKINEFFTTKDGLFTGAGDQCLFITKANFIRLDGFNEEQVIMEDFEFWHKIKKSKIPYKIVNNNLVVSARKYDYNSYLRVNFTNLVLFLMFKSGFTPEKIKTTHNTMLNLPNDNYK